MAAAERLLREDGIEALTIRRVAASVGASRQVVYSRFGDKAGLLRALHDEGFRRLAAAVGSLDEPVGTDAHVLAVAATYRRTAHEASERFDLMFGQAGPAFQPDPSAQQVAEQAFGAIVRTARAWLAAHDGDQAQSVPLAHALWAATHGVVALERAGHYAAEAAERELADLLRRVLYGSLGVAPTDAEAGGDH